MRMISARQQAANNELERDRLFRIKYPKGRFALSFRKAVLVCGVEYPGSYVLHWKNARRYGHEIGVRTYRGRIMRDAYWSNDDSGVGGRPRRAFYGSLQELLSAARRRGFPAELITAFVTCLNKETNYENIPGHPGRRG